MSSVGGCDNMLASVVYWIIVVMPTQDFHRTTSGRPSTVLESAAGAIQIIIGTDGLWAN